MRLLDAGDSINAGLIGFWPLDENGGGMARDISRYRRDGVLTNFSGTSTSGWGHTRLGKTLQFDGTNDRIPLPFIPTPGAITISAWVMANAATQGFILNKTFDGSTVPFSLSVNPSSFAAGFSGYWNSAWRTSGVTTDIRGDGKWHHVAGSYDGATLRFFVDGKLDSSASYSTTMPSSTATTYIGTYFGDNIYFGGSMSALRLHRRALTLAEIQRLYRDQWAGTVDNRRRVIYLPSTGYTMTAGMGSYTLTGQAVGLRAGRLLTAGQGSYTLTGQAVTLKAGRRLPVDFGAFTLSGQDVAFSRGRVPLVADTGTFSLTGQDVALKAGRLLTATTALYSVSGRDATLVYSAAPVVAAVGGLGRKRTKGFKRIRLPVAQPAVAYEASSAPVELKPIAKKAWQDDDDEWILLA